MHIWESLIMCWKQEKMNYYSARSNPILPASTYTGDIVFL